MNGLLLARLAKLAPPPAVTSGASAGAAEQLASLEGLVGQLEACTSHLQLQSLEALTLRLERAMQSAPAGGGAPAHPGSAPVPGVHVAALEGLVSRMEVAVGVAAR